jgi:hypothetical protein
MIVMLKVFHPSPPCAKCRQVEKVAARVAARHPGEVEVLSLPVLSEEARSHGILLTPGVVINDRVFSTGKVISEYELENAIEVELEVEC